MFTFADLRLLLSFCGGVAASALLLAYLRRRIGLKPRPLHPGTAPGALLFGGGWAMTGACPTAALVQLGEGHLSALATLGGIIIGMSLYPWVHRRAFRWDMGLCSD